MAWPAVGINLGLNRFAALSDGTLVEAPKPLAKGWRGSRNLRESAAGLASAAPS